MILSTGESVRVTQGVWTGATGTVITSNDITTLLELQLPIARIRITLDNDRIETMP